MPQPLLSDSFETFGTPRRQNRADAGQRKPVSFEPLAPVLRSGCQEADDADHA